MPVIEESQAERPSVGRQRPEGAEGSPQPALTSARAGSTRTVLICADQTHSMGQASYDLCAVSKPHNHPQQPWNRQGLDRPSEPLALDTFPPKPPLPPVSPLLPGFGLYEPNVDGTFQKSYFFQAVVHCSLSCVTAMLFPLIINRDFAQRGAVSSPLGRFVL